MTVQTVSDGYSELRRMANDPTPRVGFGIPYIDSRTNGGLAKGQVAMVMAFSHVGKTSLALNAIKNNSDIPVLVFSIEMSWDQVVSKLTAMETGISTSRIEEEFRGREQPAYVQRVLDKHRLLLCDDSPDLSLKGAETAYERATEILAGLSAPPPRLVIFDYLELIQGAGMLTNKSEQVDKAAERVRMFCRKFKTSGILLHQVGKGDAEGGAAPLDLGSGRYGGHQTMELVIGMHAPGRKKDMASSERQRLGQQRVLQVLKNRITGQLDEAGRPHRLDPVSMALTDWNDRAPVWRDSYPAEELNSGFEEDWSRTVG